MRIAVNTRLLLPGKLEGIGWFTWEVLKRLVHDHPEHEFILLFDRPYAERFVPPGRVKAVVLPPPARHPLLYRIWFECMVPWALRRHRADVFLSPDGFLSLRTSVPQLPVIHDLNFEHHPEDLPKAYGRYYRHYFPRFAKKAGRILTVSNYSRQDIATRYDIPADRIDVVYNGVGDVFTPLDAAQRETVRQRLTGGTPYFVCVGSLHPRKNIARLLQAFDRFAADRPEARLVIVGEAFWWDARMKEAWGTMRHTDRVTFTGRLEQQELHQVLGAALALVFVAYFEGFGIPVAEAMKCGVPVIAANTTSLPEVGGEAALYCDPFDVGSIRAALEQLWSDAELHDRLAREGPVRAERYSWDRTAEGVWQSLERLMQERSLTR